MVLSDTCCHETSATSDFALLPVNGQDDTSDSRTQRHHKRHEQTGQNNTAEATRQTKTKTQQAIEDGSYAEVHDLIMTLLRQKQAVKAVEDHMRSHVAISCCMIVLHVRAACHKQGKLPCSSIGRSCGRWSSKAA